MTTYRVMAMISVPCCILIEADNEDEAQTKAEKNEIVWEVSDDMPEFVKGTSDNVYEVRNLELTLFGLK